MDDARKRIFGPAGTPGLASGAVGGDLREDEPAPYPDGIDADDWGLADVPIDLDVDVRVSLRRDFDPICELCRLGNVPVPEDTSGVFGLALPDLKAVKERELAVAVNAVALERVHVVEEPVNALLAGWNPEKIAMVTKCDESCSTVEPLNTDLAAVHERIPGQAAEKSENNCNLSFVMLETHLLGSGLGEGRLVSMLRPLNVLLRWLSSKYCSSSHVGAREVSFESN